METKVKEVKNEEREKKQMWERKKNSEKEKKSQ